MSFEPVSIGDSRDYSRLNRAVDRVKSRVFMGSDAAFFGPLMSSMNFVWSTQVDTAACNGTTLWWNPDFFDEAPEKYQSKTFNEFVLRHELWHPGRLHGLRVGNRCPDVWNYACDIRINNDIKRMSDEAERNKKPGFSWGTFPAWYDPSYDNTGKGLAAEEDIYDQLKKQGFKAPQNPWGNGDLVPTDGSNDTAVLNNVVRAMTSAKMSGNPGAIPGNIQGVVDKFLTPIIPWEQELKVWFTDLQEHDYSWSRPNRRYSDMYLPCTVDDDGRLAHLMYFQDVSGSVTDPQVQRFNSELKYVWEELKPQKMTIVQFDTRITKIDVLKEGDTFTRIEIIGRGGTCLKPVRELIIKEQPTAAIIFSDMAVAPMEKLPVEIPILWVAIDAPATPVPFGRIIYIKA